MGLCACQHPAPWGAGQYTQKTGPVPHNTDAAPTRAGAVQDPAPFPAGCLWGCPTLLRALQGARAVLTILDMAPRDCHFTTLHVASRCSDGFTAAAPALGELLSCCSQTQALAGNQLTLPLCCAKGEGLEKLGESWIRTDLCLCPALIPVPLCPASLCQPGQLGRSHPALGALHEFLASELPHTWWFLAP